MEKILLSIISSEKTWTNFSKFGFDKQLNKHREKLDFAVVLNGYNSEAIDFYKNFSPQYFFLRPNLGFDSAAIAYLINLLPEYEHYIIMHDDHWFSDDKWLEIIFDLVAKNPEVDIWGNILIQEAMARYKEYCIKLNLPHLINNDSDKFLHGMSGIFNKRAINSLKDFEIPYIMSGEKEDAFLGERLFSNIINYLNLSIQQFPEGIFNFFLHGEGNYKNHLFSTANVAYHTSDFKKAKEYFYKYYEYCTKNNFLEHMGSLFNNLACTHYRLDEKKEAKYIWQNLLDKVPQYPVPSEAMQLLNDNKY